MVQTYEPWWPLAEQVEKRFLSAELVVDFPDAVVRLDQGYREGVAIGPSVVIEFPNVAATALHEEYVHPWNANDDEPVWPKQAHVAIVQDSVWLQSFSLSQLAMYEAPVHYRIVTEFPIIDIICTGAPLARYQPAPPHQEDSVANSSSKRTR
ncbi:hypothetical protein GCM10027285_15700 [Oleiagrimonas citrea]|uniref:Uncharacterized protein n=1 Tax=Oleiagrimonas citrea TaxID=1665687 RepID=A0A846ZKQ8_9GAMM|nr:hypothetical protein [Oleiagrimonas citrea]NKZ38110.1 hypothetical protein [Oleiagrimonas citrea]